MKIGSKLAVYKILKETIKDDKYYYVARLVETIYNSQIPYSNKTEQSFYNNCNIYTNFKLVEADFSKEVEDVVYKYKSGKTFTKKEPKYSFKRIKNTEDNCVIKINAIEVANMSCWKNKKQICNQETNKPKIQTIFFLKDVEVAHINNEKVEKKKVDDDFDEDFTLNNSIL